MPPLNPRNPAGFVPYIIAVRALQALLAAAIPFLVFLIGRNLWGPWAGLVAAFLMACDPVHLTYSRQEMGEIPQTFWVMLSLFFATRVLTGGRPWDGLLAGLFAGTAAATKMYGGYIILAPLTAALISPPGRFRKTGFTLMGLLTGLVIGSPYLWVDPAGWWSNTIMETLDEFFVRLPGQGGRQSGLLERGLIYLWQGLNHRFHLPWMIMAVLGIGFLIKRHNKKDLFFLIPLSAALLLIGFSLSYLREWDFVNLTPYLAMAMAALIVSLFNWMGPSVFKKIISIGLIAFLAFQGLVALNDALIARLPDTRQLARQWVLRHVDSGAPFFYEANVSGGAWIPDNLGLSLIGTSVKNLLKEKPVPGRPPAGTAVLERIWWDPPLSRSHYQPLQVFDLRSTYWENPEISFFRLAGEQSTPDLILPHTTTHTTVGSPEPSFPNTPWSRRQPLDLLSNPAASP
jgi:hypothetical protein